MLAPARAFGREAATRAPAKRRRPLWEGRPGPGADTRSPPRTRRLAHAFSRRAGDPGEGVTWDAAHAAAAATTTTTTTTTTTITTTTTTPLRCIAGAPAMLAEE